MAKTVKRESTTARPDDRAESTRQGVTERRVLRSRYLAVKNLINDEKDDISKVDSDKFGSIIGEVESLHQFVQRPREQVADAEALLDIANTLVVSVKSQGNEGLTPSDFITSLLKNYGQQYGAGAGESSGNLISWKDVGLAVSCIFRKDSGCCTMVGPMNNELKQRRAAVQRKRARPTERTCPEEVDDAGTEEKTDTDKNMSTMFEILRRKRRVKLEALVLNRKSFAQTVENLFALSFLVKDGRAEIAVNDHGHHLISPRNAPAANAVTSGDVSYNHFVFRFDFKDWKLMSDSAVDGEELMPHRNALISHNNQMVPAQNASQPSAPTTPIRKLSRNRGLIIQEESIVDDTPENDNGKRKRLF
eukprot:TRINITY_DN6148_c0_g1_i2.p1 TRINITY_DN6148_c0_g1~~TRINITY_DN6148_c0_g1_i2.p1  ORF type:complete len:362 (-),score=84.67 TRINITY_DN6148_c0_g1_i2:167-1252(-)